MLLFALTSRRLDPRALQDNFGIRGRLGRAPLGVTLAFPETYPSVLEALPGP